MRPSSFAFALLGAVAVAAAPAARAELSDYYNVVHPDNGANWQLRLQVQLMFPR
jgi:hypothetical protein